MNGDHEILRVVVEVKNLGKNSKELIYKQLRKKSNEKLKKLDEIKKKLNDSK